MKEHSFFKMIDIFRTECLFLRVYNNTLENGLALQNMSSILKKYILSDCKTTGPYFVIV